MAERLEKPIKTPKGYRFIIWGKGLHFVKNDIINSGRFTELLGALVSWFLSLSKGREKGNLI